MDVKKCKIPVSSVLNTEESKFDFVDSFQCPFYDENDIITPSVVGKLFFTSGPDWVGKLFTLRNKLVGIFGLKTSGNVKNRQQMLDNFKCELGEQLGLFKVFYKTEKEVVLGENDKHLDFRILLFINNSPFDSSKKYLTISTTVVFHNWFGKLYFLPVKPFHKLIVPRMLKGIIGEINEMTKSGN